MTEQVMQVINSNDLSALSEICARIIKSPVSNGSDPFASETVITMNKGMKVYLQQLIHFSLLPEDQYVTARRSGYPCIHWK